MGRFLGVRELYPKYPIQLVTPPGSKVRFGTRDAYVDVSWLVYRLYTLLWEHHEGRGDREEISRLIQQVESELKEKLGDYADMYSIAGPIRRKGDRPYLRLVIKWDRLLDYLEYKARACIEKAKRGEDKGAAAEAVRDLYIEDIINNYIGLLLISGPRRALKLIVEHAGVESDYQRQSYKKLLSRLGEIDEVRGLVSRLERAFNALAKAERERLASRLPEDAVIVDNLIISHVVMSTRGIMRAIEESVSVHEAYLYMRRSMETLVRLLSFYRGLEYIEPDLFKAVDLAYDKLYKDRARVNWETLTELGLNPEHAADLVRIYAMVSEVIHRIPKPPFYSLLEFKVFKHILKWYVETLEAIAGVEAPRGKGRPDRWEALAREQRAIEDAILLARHYHREVAALVRSLVEQLPETERDDLELLARLAPSVRTLRRGLVTEADYNESILRAAEQLRGLGDISLALALHTLSKLKRSLAHALLQEGTLSTRDEQHAEKTAFYLLLLTLKSLTL